ncbi:MAG: DNA-directed RNA polymerase subunit H, partial [Candidatus Heimdallarchaeota archaeon]|nr:DNA-directed RNA polymerase subunit H [Candidatus Heimdallarchaeota archaeon]
TAEREARDLNIIALKKNHPVFNIFSHFLVPDHELMTPEEINEMLITHNAKINQLPRIYDDDPGVVAVNGKVGEVIRIIRAEGSLNFRLIVPRPESGMTESTAMVELQEMTKKQRMKKKKAPTKQIDDDIDDDDDVNDDADINDDDD